MEKENGPLLPDVTGEFCTRGSVRENWHKTSRRMARKKHGAEQIVAILR
jgi:hypothetical protein